MRRAVYTAARALVPGWAWEAALNRLPVSQRWTPVLVALMLERTWAEYQQVSKS